MTLPTHFWHLHGGSPSEHPVLILGGVHGNELTGLRIIELILRTLQLISKYTPVLDCTGGTYQIPGLKGSLMLGIGNPAALRRNTRGAEGIDLNRCFVPDRIAAAPSPQDSVDLRRAREIAPTLASARLMVDVHAVSTEAEPFVCLGRVEERHRPYLGLVPVRYVLTDPDRVLGQDTGQAGILPTTDEWVNRHGGTAFCYETGNQTDMTRLPQLVRTLEQILIMSQIADETWIHDLARWLLVRIAIEEFAGVLPEQENISEPAKVYALKSCVHATRTCFVYEPGMDRVWVPVTVGERIGHYTDNGEPAIAEEEGLVVFQKRPDLILQGADTRLYYLAVPESD